MPWPLAPVRSCGRLARPGSRVLHSTDSGKTWASYSTGQSLPLYDLKFVDDQNGWAVGELGTILATRDGGHSWKRTRRAGGTRACGRLFRSGSGSAAGTDCQALGRRRLSGGNRSPQSPRPGNPFARFGVHAAANARSRDVGGGAPAHAAWRFPARPAALRLSGEELVELWNRTNDGQWLDRLEAHLVSRIRMWRPDVVFTSPSGGKVAEPNSALISQIVPRAVERAADATRRYPDQITELGLATWKVRKVYACLKPGENGTSNINTSQMSAHHGGAIPDLAAPSRGLTTSVYAAPPATLGFRLLVDHIPQELGQRDFFSGITLQPGGEMRGGY